jgi:hypothetical protein
VGLGLENRIGGMIFGAALGGSFLGYATSSLSSKVWLISLTIGIVGGAILGRDG